ncbi:MAG: amidohydrolase [Deltaproteobacteria bacterium]|nr:amidohydrolase [Deltaproteobacteria bacterium]
MGGPGSKGRRRIVAAARVLDPHLPAGPPLRGVELDGGRVRRLLGEAELAALPPAEIEDHGDATILPGLCDAHLHLAGLGRGLRQLDLREAASPEAIREQVAAAARDLPPGSWIRGRGWDQHRWEGAALPHRAVLDAATTEHPVWLARVDGHAAWLNDRALALAGIDARTPDPPGGTIVRDARGEPTGVIIDNALSLAGKALPERDAAERRADLLAGVAHCRSLGLTSVHDMGTRPLDLPVLRALADEGALDLRVVVYLDWDEAVIAAELPRPRQAGGLLPIVGVKLYADGALGSHGAALEAPYLDRPGERGLLLTEPAVLRERALRVARAGYDLAIHGIGDRGCRHALEAFEAVRAEGHAVNLRLEHAQILGPDAIERMVRARIVPSVQPTHATSDMAWVEARLGSERMAGAYAWRSLADAGLVLALGSDAPIEPADPWFGIHAAVTRQDRRGSPEGGWRRSEALSLDEALRGFTSGGARAAGLEAPGTLREGAPADLTIVRGDPAALPPGDLHRLEILGTLLGEP